MPGAAGQWAAGGVIGFLSGLVLPLLGPSNLRDTVGLVGDLNVDPIWGVEDIGERNRLTALRFINRRAQLLGADTTADQAALDKYGYMRSFYIQYRRSQVYDGRPPREKDEDDDSGAE